MEISSSVFHLFNLIHLCILYFCQISSVCIFTGSCLKRFEGVWLINSSEYSVNILLHSEISGKTLWLICLKTKLSTCLDSNLSLCFSVISGISSGHPPWFYSSRPLAPVGDLWPFSNLCCDCFWSVCSQLPVRVANYIHPKYIDWEIIPKPYLNQVIIVDC